MKVFVTGGTGSIGKAVLERLLEHGCEVRTVDLAPTLELPEIQGISAVEYAQCDILDYPALREQMHGCDTVIHLAALRSPTMASGHIVFQSNVQGTFNVFEAASANGIKRVAYASSINALGCAYNTVDMPLKYLPIDEAHPSFTTDPYSFAKEVIEDIGAYYWRRDGISSVAMRFPWVYPRGHIQSEMFHQRVQDSRKVIDELVALPEAERSARVATARGMMLEYRGERPLEFDTKDRARPREFFTEDPVRWMYGFDRFNFWTFVDERDAAQSLHKGVTTDYEGSHVLFINDDHNWLGRDTAIIAKLFYPEVSEWKSPLAGTSSLVSIEKARKLIGFAPEYSVSTLSLDSTNA